MRFAVLITAVMTLASFELTGDPALAAPRSVSIEHVSGAQGSQGYLLSGHLRALYEDRAGGPLILTDAALNHQVACTHWPAGSDIFRAMAANNDGVWSKREAELEFSTMSAPWRSWWAYLFYLLALATLAATLLRAHERRTQQAAKPNRAKVVSTIQGRLAEAQRIASLGSWELDTRSNDLWWSDETYRLFQADPESTKPTCEAFLAHVHPDDRESVREAVDVALHGKQPYSIEHRIIRKDGTERVVCEQAEVTLDKKGKPIRMAGTVHDVTERRKTEDQIRHRARFQALLARLSADLIQARPDDIDQQLQSCLGTVGSRYDLDVISLWWPVSGPNKSMQVVHRWVRTSDSVREREFDQGALPWIAERLTAGKLVAVKDISELTADAATDRKALEKRRIKSFLIVPLLIEEQLTGTCVFSTVRQSRDWSATTTDELKLIAESLIGAVARTNAIIEIRKLKDKLHRENLYLRDQVRLAHGTDEIIGKSPDLTKCLQLVEKVAPTDAAVLLLGETGTGKELFARAIRKLSTRSEGPMISVNCAALPANLIESELFGHEKGAFTGAQSQRHGRFEFADGGTLFLDEVGELPLELQSKLLRVLQTGEFQRLGGSKTLHADVRLIVATNRNLISEIESGEFRADLYDRVASFPIRLPALRNRQEDIPLLAEHYVHKHAERLGKKIEAISAKMLTELSAYDWPGNVRELESVIERALISAEDNSVLDLPGPLSHVGTTRQSTQSLSIESGADLFEVERAYIITVLGQTDWKISGAGGAASILGVPASTLRSKMKRLHIERERR